MPRCGTMVPAPRGSRPLGLDDLLASGEKNEPPIARTVPDRTSVRQRGKRLLDVGEVVGPVHLIEVEVVGAQPAQTVLHRAL